MGTLRFWLIYCSEKIRKDDYGAVEFEASEPGPRIKKSIEHPASSIEHHLRITHYVLRITHPVYPASAEDVIPVVKNSGLAWCDGLLRLIESNPGGRFTGDFYRSVRGIVMISNLNRAALRSVRLFDSDPVGTADGEVLRVEFLLRADMNGVGQDIQSGNVTGFSHSNA
jgi:hypothetical protein